jgi:hypothetical protein
MHLSKVTFVAAVIGLSGLALAGPVRRQEGGDELTTTTIPGDNGGSPTLTTTTTIPGGGGGGTITTTTPGSDPTPTPDPRPDDQCPPCTDRSFKFTPVPGGRECSCLGGGDTAPWSWEPYKCINDVTGLPNDEGRPSVCLGSGGNPNSRACLVSPGCYTRAADSSLITSIWKYRTAVMPCSTSQILESLAIQISSMPLELVQAAYLLERCVPI